MHASGQSDSNRWYLVVALLKEKSLAPLVERNVLEM